jgi:threonylcarbamoyladenosine tRNA methylthiotransferase MtaB
MKIAFCTLGCKINQFDTAAMQQQAVEASHSVVPFEEEADVYVINTCSVTEKSDYQSRQLVRRALKTNPAARIVVTGCYAQTHPEELLQIQGVDVVLGNQEKGDWLNYLGGCEKAAAPLQEVNTVFSRGPLQQPIIHRFGERTRAFVKVQDGCDFKCSFCLIPRARGPSRSVLMEQIIGQIRSLVDGGYQEAVLTGVNLGLYGRDFEPKQSLADLVRRILRETDLPRLRLSSIEPKTITPELIEILSSLPRICRHLHIPLQSGDDQVLKRMNRHYTASYYRELIHSIHAKIPGIGIGTDVMVGFPEEGETEFKHTFDLLSDLPMSYFHVFPYSPRPQTPAASFRGQVTNSIKSGRSLLLRRLGQEKMKKFQEAFLGRSLKALVEEERDPDSGRLKGYTDNYIKVLLDGPDSHKNKILSVRPTSLLETGVLCKIEH